MQKNGNRAEILRRRRKKNGKNRIDSRTSPGPDKDGRLGKTGGQGRNQDKKKHDRRRPRPDGGQGSNPGRVQAAVNH